MILSKDSPPWRCALLSCLHRVGLYSPEADPMANPFQLRWTDGWIFQTVLMDGTVQVEALGHGQRLRAALQPGESPMQAADRLVQQCTSS